MYVEISMWTTDGCQHHECSASGGFETWTDSCVAMSNPLCTGEWEGSQPASQH